MRVPLSWLREYVDLPTEVTGRDLATTLIAAGLEVETVEELGRDLSGPLVVGEVRTVEELTGFKKPIRFCTVDVGRANGTGEPQEIVCGAVNFTEGDRVAVVLPGATLPGGFTVDARTTYGRTSAGMICSASELGLWEDHTGILVLNGLLDPVPEPGTEVAPLLGLRDDILDIAVTPDRGYALSMRGIAREAAVQYDVAFRDPAEVETKPDSAPGHPATIQDPSACDRFVLRGISGFDPGTPSPLWLRHRLSMAGMRSVSLAVDVTNYVMWELGQPLHAFDRDKLSGAITVRRAKSGEQLTTLDHVERELDPDDLVIADESGPVGLAGTMGGLYSEIDESSTELVLEAAHFSATGVARTARRHKLSSEAARRFERGVDRELPLVASSRASELLVSLGGGRVHGLTHAEAVPSAELAPPAEITLAEQYASRVAGVEYPRGRAAQRLRQIGCTVLEDGAQLRVTPPTWRGDLSDPNDLAEEVIRHEGYENLPSIPPRAPAGRGLTPAQRLRRSVARALAGDGLVEVLSYPFLGERELDALQLAEDDPRRGTLRLANPLNEDEPLLRTTLLPGLLRTLARNVGRGNTAPALFEVGSVYLPNDGAPPAPILPVDRKPTEVELAEIEAALPAQPRHVGAALAGDREPSGWWGPGRSAIWADAIEIARVVVRTANAEPVVRAAESLPWHPGRCAAVYVTLADGTESLVGHAGELHPRVVQAYGLPERTVALELDLDGIELAQGVVSAPQISTFPVATQDVALVVSAEIPVAEVENALIEGAGELLEELRLFDVYTGEQVGAGSKSVAYTLRFRAPDRTLTSEEITAARDGAVAVAAERFGATLRS
ncbi:phenylalanine--tRNA ligase subunit beta [Lipingzhangella sp. LS1_29]|uniref:Phenylalanine--tRNA ligase beta subunit n=1 Tax=Lipingzhangella rawalii TaxID=2055835 RepID=A0ABU2H8R0_9ACTN|nr:phenylalanine--tRNA ligase subunit beta [Lipingzhangella rawalii]MDS1271382.1 phenylalanine--tRNA ligase subunit beta [Lipingzhangella rawalii]